MYFSIGLFAHNEEKNIAHSIRALLNQNYPDRWKLKQLVIIVSGSTDNTVSLAQKLAQKHSIIKVIVQSKRAGKVYAVNRFLRATTSRYLVLANADNLVKKNSLSILLDNLRPRGVGMVGSRIIPKNKLDNFFGFAAHLQWNLHHKINLQFPDRPKAGELVAFKRVFKRLHQRVPFDEANIEAIMHTQGFKVVYCPEAIVYNFGPTNLWDFISLRRRNYAGHLRVKKVQGYQVVTFSNFRLLGAFMSNIDFKFKSLLWSAAVMSLEMFSRTLAVVDVIITNKTYRVWRTISSSKMNLKPKPKTRQAHPL